MNLWIDIAHDSLLRTIRTVDCVIVNDAELKQLTDEPNLVRAAQRGARPRPDASSSPSRASTARRCSRRDGFFGLPAYPLANVVDPTGAGDSFAGGFMGYVAAHAGEELTDELLRRAMASAPRSRRSTSRRSAPSASSALEPDEIAERGRELQRITRFEDAPVPLRA